MIAVADATPLLEVHNLCKSFGTVPALDRVSFSIDRAEVVGLIGPNGAGKTTLLECLAGVLPRDAGDVTPTPMFYIPDAIAPWELQPVAWVLQFFAALHHTTDAAALTVSEQLGLTTFSGQSVASLSRGQRKRLLVGLGLLSQPPLLLLDEPFDGLDLRQSRDVARTLREHVAAGRTLFLSIHQLSDAAQVCDRMVLLSGGRVVATGTLAELRQVTALPGATLEEIFLALT